MAAWNSGCGEPLFGKPAICMKDLYYEIIDSMIRISLDLTNQAKGGIL